MTVAKLMNCSHTHARELLKSWKNVLKRDLTLDDIGELIQEYRNRRELKRYANRMQ